MKAMQIQALREKIERSLPVLSEQDLVRVAHLIESFTHENIQSPIDGSQSEKRSQWLDRLRRTRSQLGVLGETQTVLEMRQEERY
jgi:hypothetical protein